ncbi:TetR/AcrR family transcriptional regulator [Curtobacterium sp. VKM Ac-2865]|uniref:TetR/AcrR family transcriptional regulator n=1 Tax=Curtobacterium sp. VKM Ac-2865 TaxID=2783817 RepID=UPI00188CA83F|nr:TetR/AcrR family transcriptional regulator [Curtobacterium sp. VKM Ac-2865]MBF4583320.1 TetR/AcrR family transcriptional regulator [Curtobacterium sp. VKM Ac-2865]
MATTDRRQRERSAQRDLIVASARSLAEQEGWEAVTTRRLATEIEYSQPVIYKHFASLDALVEAVALEGFAELAAAIHHARVDVGDADADPVGVVAHAYVDWAAANPSLYDAMFIRATGLHFGAEETPPQLTDGYAELLAATSVIAGDRDPDVLAEVLWAALHGLVLLDRGGRLRAAHRRARVEAVAALLAG